MKNYLCRLFILLILASCDSNGPGEKSVSTDTASIKNPGKTDSAKPITDNHYFWVAELDQRAGLLMKKTNPISNDSLNESVLISMMNETYPEIRLQFLKISNDSIFVKIKNSKYLTQQMGSSGGESYLAEVTYNLTELPHITYVNFSFKAGDHASPGTYQRTDFVYAK